MAPFHWSKIPQKNSPLPLPFALHLKTPTQEERNEREKGRGKGRRKGMKEGRKNFLYLRPSLHSFSEKNVIVDKHTLTSFIAR